MRGSSVGTGPVISNGITTFLYNVFKQFIFKEKISYFKYILGDEGKQPVMPYKLA